MRGAACARLHLAARLRCAPLRAPRSAAGQALAWQMALMSQICMRGLVGDSSMTNAVWPGRMAARTALHTGWRGRAPVQRVSMPGLRTAGHQQRWPAEQRSSERAMRRWRPGPPAPSPPAVAPAHSTSLVSTLLTSMPALGTTRDSRRDVPPYRSSPATTWSPDLSRRVTAASAAMPLLKAKARSAPCWGTPRRGGAQGEGGRPECCRRRWHRHACPEPLWLHACATPQPASSGRPL